MDMKEDLEYLVLSVDAWDTDEVSGSPLSLS